MTVAEVSSESFSLAMRDSVAEAIGVQASAVSGTVTVGNGRRLLSAVSAVYTVSTVSGLSSSEVLSRLRSSLSSATFLSSLKNKSKLPIESVTVFELSQATPAPSPFPVQQLTVESDKTGACWLISAAMT